jgi:pimeloyl-ACP methyl ester carboxylesterase
MREGRRIRWRRWLFGLGVLGLLWLVPVWCGAYNLSGPVDWLMNRGSFPRAPELALGRGRTLVVLQHGLWRDAMSLDRLERALRAHGYETLNPSYPSTNGTIEQHAARLRAAIDDWRAKDAGPAPGFAFVGHSMGGLVIRCYLQQPGAVQASACVFLGTPHQGAALVDRRKDLWLFTPLMGDEAVLQMRPQDPLILSLAAPACPFGNVVGARGDPQGWNAAVPGDDDGTVAVAEARLAGETDAIELTIGHTRLSFDDLAIRQVLCFLRHHRFDRNR